MKTITVNPKQHFQFRVASSAPWTEVNLAATGLRQIATEVAGLPRNAKAIKTLYDLHNKVLDFYNAHKDADPAIFDISSPDYEVVSNQDDVLKVKYSFVTRYIDPKTGKAARVTKNLNQHLAPKVTSGIMTLMPGN